MKKLIVIIALLLGVGLFAQEDNPIVDSADVGVFKFPDKVLMLRRVYSPDQLKHALEQLHKEYNNSEYPIMFYFDDGTVYRTRVEIKKRIPEVQKTSK